MDSNRTRVSLIREAVLGVTPNTPRMRTARITSETLRYSPSFFLPNEIRADRMNADPALINQNVSGGFAFEQTYPDDLDYLSEALRSAMYNLWVNTPQHDNDGTADSVLTGYVATTGTMTVVNQSGSGGFAGTDYKTGHLVQLSGMTAANNNFVKKVTSSTATTVVFGSGGTDDTTPAAWARMKVVGCEGASADLAAVTDGITSTANLFSTVAPAVGQWVCIGGTAAGTRFTNAANNGWARVIAVAAGKLTLDNLPTGWSADAGTGKTIRLFWGDYIRNGQTRTSLSIEKSFLGQAVPTHVIHRGMVANTYAVSAATGQAITGNFDFMGLTGEQATTAFGNSYVGASTFPILTGNASVGAILEAGVVAGTPNWARRVDFNLNNNLRMIDALGNIGAVEMGVGEAGLTGTIETYFGSNAQYAKLLAGTITALSSRAQSTKTVGQTGHAIIHTAPRVTFTEGSPNAPGKNQDVMLSMNWSASRDPLTDCVFQIDRLEYFEM